MAYPFGLSQQFNRQIIPKIKEVASQAVLATLKNAADTLIANIDKYWLGEGALRFLGVTGNAYASVTIGVYQKNKLVYANWNGKHVDRPTMPSLKKGQKYPLPEYYDGDMSKGYVGEYGSGGQWGQQAGPWAIYSQRYNKGLAGDWNMVVAIPVSYAGYNPKIVHAMQNIMDAIPSAIDKNIVSVQGGATAQDMFANCPF